MLKSAVANMGLTIPEGGRRCCAGVAPEDEPELDPGGGGADVDPNP